MPHRPEDDWTRPIPRHERGGGNGRRHGGPGEHTQRIPRDEAERYAREHDDWGDRGQHDDRYDDWGDQGRYDDHDRHDDHQGGAHRYDPDDIPAGRGSGGPPRPPRRRRPRYAIRRFFAVLVVLLLVYLVSMVVVLAMVWGSINRVDATPEVQDRPGAAAGQNYLLVGTDSREELTEEQRSDFGTGDTEGHRADSVMLLHVPGSGDPTLVSLPRDSYVEIRDHGWNKLNTAHSIGGPELLVDSVEQSTGLPISGYLEIGFGGFVSVVDKVGGVEMCLDAPIQDTRAHIDLPAGCQELSGRDALGYVRMRYSDPLGDMGRIERQREFLAALVDRMATPATVLVPWRLHDVGTSTGEVIAFGEDTSALEAGRMALAMRSVAGGDGISLTVPVADANYQTGVGSTVLWDEQGAAQLFTALRQGQAVSVDP